MPELATVRYKLVPVVLEDAAHLYLDETDIAQLLFLLMRDPDCGEDDGNGRLTFQWRGLPVVYRVHIDGEAIVVYVMRIRAAEPDAGIMERSAGVVRALALDVIKARLAALAGTKG